MVNEGEQFFLTFVSTSINRATDSEETGHLEVEFTDDEAMKYFSGFRYMSLFFIDK